MRILKSLGVVHVVLFFSFLPIASVQAQDSTTLIATDTVLQAPDATTITETATDSVFFFDTLAAGSSPVLTERNIPESTLQRLRRDEAFWYANATFKKKPDKNAATPSLLQNLFMQDWFRNLLWAIIICSFVAMVLLFLSKSNIRLFYRKPAALGGAAEELSQDIYAIDYEAEIKKAEQQADFRAAIRLHYLQLLRMLSEKNLIQYKEDYTNSDYIQQLGQTTKYGPFKTLTRHFEYAWYGKFYIAAARYKEIETDFKTFKNSMGI